MATKVIPAYELRPGCVVISSTGPPRRVTLARCEGAQPHVVVYWAGIPTRTEYPAIELITVDDGAQIPNQLHS